MPVVHIISMPNMTGRPGYRTVEMNGGSSAPYLACTPCVPLFCTLFNRGGNRRAFRLPGTGGGSFPLCDGTFDRSYSVSIILCIYGNSRKAFRESISGEFNMSSMYGEKKPIKKNHIKEFGSRMPRRRPRDKLGTSQGHMGHLGLIYV